MRVPGKPNNLDRSLSVLSQEKMEDEYVSNKNS